MTQRAGDPAFPEAGRPGDQQVLVATDPGAVDEMGDDGAVDTPRCAKMPVLDAGGLTKGRGLEPGGKALGVPLGGLMIDQQTEPVFEVEIVEGGRDLALRVQRLGHAGDAQGDEALGRGVGQQGQSPFNDGSLGRGCWRAGGGDP